jgi:predicted nucleic acid-binding protein
MAVVIADECLRRQAIDAERIANALQAGWLQCVDNPMPKHQLSRSLGIGEQTNIEYALQSDSKTLLILDHALVRKQALRFNLSLIGTAAVLFMAQRKGLISNQVVEQLKQQL